ncbi:MAG: hypothetical protein JOZ02_22050 [Acidobacteria bacterium]|nr:hypothetical protein [Acidobacteriota bacterium]
MNRLRVVTLTLLVLVTTAGMLPITESLAKWSRSSAVSSRKRHRKHSRAWWRRHRALARARRARALERRRLTDQARGDANPGINTALLTFNANANAPFVPADGTTPPALALTTKKPAAPATLASTSARAAEPARSSLLPFDFETPHNWTAGRRGRSGAAVFTVAAADGRAAGTAVVAPVSLSGAELAGVSAGPKTKTLGGTPVAALRRTVIDRMVAEGGWVTNDFVQELHGRKVFVVQAQTGTPGAPAQSLTFYFTEIDGRLYSLATTAPFEFAAPVAAGSEQFMASLQPAASRNTASQK